MTRYLFAVAFLLASGSVRAETNICIPLTQSDLPLVITQPGAYCLTEDVTYVGPAFTFAITIVAPDVVLDCNSHSLTGAIPTALAPTFNAGIVLNASARSTVRNCRVTGFDAGIALSASDESSTDAIIEDNRVASSGYGIVGSTGGVSRVRQNGVLDTILYGLQLEASSGTLEVAGNFVSRSGNNTDAEGHGGEFETSGINPRIFLHDNVFAEIQSPGGQVEEADAAVTIIAGSNVEIENNVVTAPAVDYDKGYITMGISNEGTGPCRGNITAGYPGQANNPGCLAVDNRLY